ncbi:hypothetical protein [Paractinoplanes toevensis]|uniref:Uncharacterized protein n=1 Tax=Paractinoplanes toevensis TaxID=571911 RepID=A0A919W189_9ACTN|nr:hypothetical protein [Actinoplanes toevensis]GIM90139.1 hypothetical protein Ato02nite_019320 [Actinoplanes toevensis]
MTSSTTAVWPTSHLQAADIAFAALTCEPDPLSLDCDAVATAAGVDCGLPPGTVPLTELRQWLLANPHYYLARDIVWRELVRLARTGAPHWVVAAVGMAMPALIRAAAELTADHQGDAADIDNEILTGFLDALRNTVDLDKPAVCASLVYAGFRAGQRVRVERFKYVPVEDIEHAVPGPRLPQLPYGHPDLLIERAATLGLIDDEDVQPWIDTRLARHSVPRVAQGLGLPADLLRMRLARADSRIGEAVLAGLLSGSVSSETVTRLSERASRRGNIRAAMATPATHGPTTAAA